MINKGMTDFWHDQICDYCIHQKWQKAYFSLQDKYWVFSRINVRLFKSISLSFIRWWGNVVYSVEKSYVNNLEAWKFLDLNLLRLSLEFLIDQNS